MVSLKRLSPPSGRGFSLVELMITVTIIGLFSAIVMGSMAETRRRATTRLAALELVGLFDSVRRAAMASNINCSISFSNPSSFSVKETDELNTSPTAGHEGDLCARGFAGGMAHLDLGPSSSSTLHIVAPTPTTALIFNHIGTVVNAETQIYYLSLPDSSLERCVAVTAPVGLVRLGQRVFAGPSNAASCDYVAGY